MPIQTQAEAVSNASLLKLPLPAAKFEMQAGPTDNSKTMTFLGWKLSITGSCPVDRCLDQDVSLRHVVPVRKLIAVPWAKSLPQSDSGPYDVRP